MAMKYVEGRNVPDLPETHANGKVDQKKTPKRADNSWEDFVQSEISDGFVTTRLALLMEDDTQ